MRDGRFVQTEREGQRDRKVGYFGEREFSFSAAVGRNVVCSVLHY